MPRSIMSTRQAEMYLLWHSDWKITLPPCAGPELGPSMQKKFGKSGTVRPRWAVGLLLAHLSRRFLAPRPVILRRAAISVILKPVAITMMSAARDFPSEVTMLSRLK